MSNTPQAEALYTKHGVTKDKKYSYAEVMKGNAMNDRPWKGQASVNALEKEYLSNLDARLSTAGEEALGKAKAKAGGAAQELTEAGKQEEALRRAQKGKYKPIPRTQVAELTGSVQGFEPKNVASPASSQSIEDRARDDFYKRRLMGQVVSPIGASSRIFRTRIR